MDLVTLAGAERRKRRRASQRAGTKASESSGITPARVPPLEGPTPIPELRREEERVALRQDPKLEGQLLMTRLRAAMESPARQVALNNCRCNMLFKAGFTHKRLSTWEGLRDNWGTFISALRSDNEDTKFGDNILCSLYRTSASLLMSRDPIPVVSAPTQEPADLEAARAAQAWFDWDWTFQNMRDVRREALFWRRMSGSCLIKVVWDRFAGDAIVTAQGSLERTGEVKRFVIPPWNWALDPAASTFEQARFIFHLTLRSEDEIRARWGERLKELLGEDAEIPNALDNTQTSEPEELVKVHLGKTEWGELFNENNPDSERTVLLSEYWERPTAEFPTGRVVIHLGEHILAAFPPEEPDEPHWPFYHLQEIACPDNPYGDTPWTHARPLVVKRNELMSSLLDDISDLSPRWAMEKTGSTSPSLQMSPGGKAATSASRAKDIKKQIKRGDLVLLYSERPPAVVGGAPFDANALALLDRLETQLRQLLQVYEFSQFEVPHGAKTAAHMNILHEGLQTELHDPFTMEARLWRDIHRHTARIVKAYYPPERLIRVIGEDGASTAMAFRAAIMTDDLDIRIEPERLVPRSPAERTQQIYGLLQMGILHPQRDRDVVLRLLEFPEARELHRVRLLNERMARKENELFMMQPARFVPPTPYDEHATHLRIHQEQYIRAHFEVPDANLQVLDDHMSWHTRLLLGPLAENEAGLENPSSQPNPGAEGGYQSESGGQVVPLPRRQSAGVGANQFG